jgi:hypothetical protein
MEKSMIYNKFTTSSSKDIHIFDGLFTHQELMHMYTFALGSTYKIKEADTTVREYLGYTHLVSNYSDEDVNHFGIFGFKSFAPVADLLNGYTQHRTYLNLCTTSDRYFYHTDGNENELTLLYYANVEWNVNWEGETPFASDDLQHIEYASPYVPGRVVLFNASIPHKSSQPLPGAPYYRFTFVTKFKKV